MMLTYYILCLIGGILSGVATGLIPGLHVNTIAIVSFSFYLMLNIDPIAFSIFLCAMATTHTFLDFIPAIFLGAPDEDTALSILPTHKLLLQGRGLEAVKLTGLASLYGVVFSLILVTLAFSVIPALYSMMRLYIAPLLILIIASLIAREKTILKKLWSLQVFIISGYFGWVCLNKIAILSSNEIFFPMFSGLFGISTLIIGAQSRHRIYVQDKLVRLQLKKKEIMNYSFIGAVGGCIVGLLPGVSPSQIGILFQQVLDIGRKTKEGINIRRFITIVASLNTADAIFSIFALYLISNPRSGVSVIIENIFGTIDLSMFSVFALTMLLSGIITYPIHLYIGSRASWLVSRIDFRLMCKLSIICLILLIGYFSGFLGIFIAVIGTIIGIIPIKVGISRTHVMGCLLVPTLVYFL